MLLGACLICAAALGAGLLLGARSTAARNASGDGWPLVAWSMAGHRAVARHRRLILSVAH